MSFTYDPTNANVRSSFATLMKSFPEIRNVFYDEFRLLPAIYDKFLIVESSTKQTETENTVGPRPEWVVKAEAAEFVFGDMAQGVEVPYTHTTFTDAFDASEELVEDNQWKGIFRNAREMARGGYAAVENNAADVLNNAFAGGSTGADGGQLCDPGGHNLINSGSTGVNSLTTALSADGLNDAYIIGDVIVNEANVIVPIDYDCLIVPPQLRKTGEELIKSEWVPDSANNAYNVFNGRIKKLIVDPYLTSSTAWFLASSSSIAKGKFYWRVKPMFYNDRDHFSGNFLMKARERFSFGHTDWQGIIGSTGIT